MSIALARFQDDFAHALLASEDEALQALPGLAGQPGFAIYRNTVLKACIDALQANHPAVARLVGQAWFRAAAGHYAQAHPPSDTRLLEYGADFAGFLRGFEPAAELPYLPGVARLDRLWIEAHVAADAPPLEAGAISKLVPEQLARAVLKPHPAARWAWFPAQPIYTLWRAQREAGEDEPVDLAEIAWQGEGALLTRPGDALAWIALDEAGCVFLDACAAGRPLGAAAQSALEAKPDTELAGLMAQLLRAGAFTSLHFIEPDCAEEEQP